MTSLLSIAAQQQEIVNRSTQRAVSTGTHGKIHAAARTESSDLKQGTHSFASNPVSPPWVTMPDGGFPFSSNGTIQLPAQGAGFTDVIGPNAPTGGNPFQVPNGSDGVITDLVCFYNGQGFVSGSGQLIWRVTQDGQAVRNYDNILVQFGVAPFNGSTQIRISSNQTMRYQVSNVGIVGGGSQIYCQFVGWFYPTKLS